MPSLKKQQQVENIVNTVSESANFALLKFEKTTHTTLEELRKQLRSNESQLEVIKNTLFEKALNQLASKKEKLKNIDTKKEDMKGNSALLILGKDWNKGLSTFYQFSEKDKTMGFKVGFLDNEVYLTKDLEKIAQLPPKEQLVAKVIGGLKSPISHFTFALKFNMQKLVYVMNTKAKQAS